MLSAPQHPEIDHRTIKLVVGIIALSMATLTSAFAESPLPSISASYYEGGWSQTIFIGFLFAISALTLAYNGMSRTEMILSKVASVAALGVALFPCNCGGHPERIAHLHYVFSAAMFLVLTYMCYEFYERAIAKGHPQATARAILYAMCGVAIFLSIIVLALDNLTGGAMGASIPRLTFYGEATGLVAFGISWLTASRVLPGLTRQDERFSPFRDRNPAS